jgi:hypothetical protein
MLLMLSVQISILAESYCAECRKKALTLSVIMLNVNMLSVVAQYLVV